MNELLIELRKQGHAAEQFKAIVEELDAGGFNNLVDEENRYCRAVAVETLLAMGFPYALHIVPEDLEFARREEAAFRLLAPARWGKALNSPRLPALLLTTSGGVLAFEAVKWLQQGRFGMAGLALAQVALGVTGTYLLKKRRFKRQTFPVLVLYGSVLAGLALGAFAEGLGFLSTVVFFSSILTILEKRPKDP
ncbi:MAG: hypothetical protein ACOZIN_00265 [Myxococcota bacterium]